MDNAGRSHPAFERTRFQLQDGQAVDVVLDPTMEVAQTSHISHKAHHKSIIR